MGQKVHPIGFRVGVTKPHFSRWYAEKKDIPTLLEEDRIIRDYINKRFEKAAISRIYIDKTNSRIDIYIHTARPGVIIGKKGAEVDKLKSELKRLINTDKEIRVNIREIKVPELDAVLVGKTIAAMIEKRMPFRKVIKRAVYNTMKAGAKGIKIRISGRLNGADMARAETIMEGRVPLQTLRADIDYALVEAFTIWGVIGIKVWIYKGDILTKNK